ncbi:MAG: lytic murein transglycosylase [Syntrophobacteraceae bacterium]
MPAARKHFGKLIGPAALFLACGLFFSHLPALASENAFEPLKKRLAADGFSPARISAAFQPEVAPQFHTIAVCMRIREGKLNYGQFVTPSAVAEGQRFIRAHDSTFAKAEAMYGVERSVIAAIMLVETHFGSYTGKTPTLAILSTFALMDQKGQRDRIWRLLSERDREKWDREAFDKKLVDRSNWAYGEIRALFRLADRQGTRLPALKGSVMGAIGWPQFLPSSLERYGADGNRDGRIDLFQPADAIFSTANYLRGYGWCEAKNQSQKEEVIWNYNHSKSYVRTVLALARHLE